MCAQLIKATFEPEGTTRWWPSAWRALNLAAFFFLVGCLLLEIGPRLGPTLPWQRIAGITLAALFGGVAFACWAWPWALAWRTPPVPVALAAAFTLILILSLHRRPHLAPGWRPACLLALGVGVLAAESAPVVAALSCLVGVVGLAVLGLPEPSSAFTDGRRWLAFLGLTLALAAAFRSHRLTELPFGLWRDEARHGLVALRMIEDPAFRPAYVAWTEPNVNMPAFGLYLLAIGVERFGVNAWSMRTVTAIAGFLTVGLLFVVARQLASTPQALLAAAFLSASSWHVWLSRYQFPTVLDPLFALAGAGLALRSRTGASVSKRCLWLFAAGFSWGLAAQTYHTGRIAPVLGVILVLFLYGLRPSAAPLVAAAALGSALALAPLLASAAEEPEALNRRVDEVALHAVAPVFGQAPVAALDQSLLRHLGMFTVRGDHNGRQNLPGRPMLDPVTGFAFLVGLAWVLSAAADRLHVFWLVALAMGTLPSALAVSGPHSMRSVAALAPACVLASLGWSCVGALWGSVRRTPAAQAAFVAAGMACVAFTGWRTVFRDMATDPRVWAAAYPVPTQMGIYLRKVAQDDASVTVYLPSGVANNSVIAYLGHGLTYGSYDRDGLSRPARPGDRLLVRGGEEQARGEALVRRFAPDAVPAREGPLLPGTSTPSFLEMLIPK